MFADKIMMLENTVSQLQEENVKLQQLNVVCNYTTFVTSL